MRRIASPTAHHCLSAHRRSGKLLVLFALLIPSLLAIAGLVLDGGILTAASRKAQHAADVAATAAAAEIAYGDQSPASVAERYVVELNQLAGATVTTHVPPTTGPYAGDDGHVEVIVSLPVQTHLMRLGGTTTVRVRAVAGREDVTDPAAIVVLDPHPPGVNVLSLPLVLPSVTPLLGGLEVLGLGSLRVDGSILVNNEWGGYDEEGNEVGDNSLQHACSCTPLLPLTRVRCRDLRVVGGVDDPDCYQAYSAGEDSPLKANRFSVPDPYASLPVPTTISDPENVTSDYRGSQTIAGIPLIGPPVTLSPGVYDWIQVVSGKVIFQPGIYIIRGRNPLTQISLSVIAGQVQAEGVMFYITNAPDYSPSSGLPDSADGESSPADAGVLNLAPSVLIDVALPGNSLAPLNSPGSPFHGMLLMQRRQDRRPIVFLRQSLLGDVNVAGNVYAKWGHVVLAGNGTYRSAFVCGSLRVLDLLNCQISPANPLPAATDVFLLE
jgi:Flp pilus assembly protein TadG